MLRHACGFALANGRHDTRAIYEWLGNRNIQHTTRHRLLVREVVGPQRAIELRPVALEHIADQPQTAAGAPAGPSAVPSPHPSGPTAPPPRLIRDRDREPDF